MRSSTNPFTTPRPTHRKIAHVALVLDRSGSMESCRDATISGFNEYADHIRHTALEENLDAKLTLTVFNHEVRMPLFQAPLENLRPLSGSSYVPAGNTAMLDAVGTTIDRLEKHLGSESDTSVLVCIISDGYENASRAFSYADIAARIQRLTAVGSWTFTYLGSNQDLSRVSEELSIAPGNVAAYAATPAGTQEAWEMHRSATARRMHDAARGVPPSPDFYRGNEDAT